MINLQVEGLEQIQENLDMMCVAVRDRILKTAVRKAGQHIVDAAKVACPEDTGTLRESIGMRVTIRGGKGGGAGAVVGPRRGIRVPVRVVRRGKHTGLVMMAIPTRYAHAVEFGHRLVSGGHVVGQVTPRPFMRPAWDEFGGENALYTIRDELVDGVEEELAKTYRYK